MQESIRALDAPDFWFWTALLAAATVAALFFFARAFHRARLIEDTPTSRIRSAVQGYVELNGFTRLMEGTPIVAPLTGTVCNWYAYSIDKREVRHTRNGTRVSWKRIRSETSGDLFLMEDGTGRCLIDPEGATVHCDHQDTWYGASPWPREGLPTSSNLFAAGDYRYQERRLMPDEPLYAIGEFRTVGTDYQANLRDDVGALLREWKSEPDRLLERFDTNRDGEIDMGEWEQARTAAEAQALRDRAERSVIHVTHVLGRGGDRRRPFILSSHPEDGLARRYRWQAAAFATGFLIALATTGFLLLARFTA